MCIRDRVNLVQNAIQFTHDGKIKVSGKRLKHGAEFSVKDNGIGMSDDQIKYIFERFFKADPSLSLIHIYKFNLYKLKIIFSYG